jgi:hypothetical protein
MSANAAKPCRVAAQEIRTGIARAAFTDALAAFPDVRFTVVARPAGFFATVAFYFADESGIESEPVRIEISTFTKSHELRAYALGMAAAADALRLCPTVTGANGYHALARVSRAGDWEPYESESAESVQSAVAPGVAIHYNFGYSGLDDPTTLFLTLDLIAETPRAALADLIIESAPVAEPGFATPQKRLLTDEESAKLAHNMCLAPSKSTGRGTKRALTL